MSEVEISEELKKRVESLTPEERAKLAEIVKDYEQKKTEYERGLDTMYHTCRWCKHYSGNGACLNPMFEPDNEDNLAVYKVSEEGKLSEVIEETLKSNKPKELIEAIDNYLMGKVAKKHREAVKKLFEEMLPEYNDFTLKEELDEAIHSLYVKELTEAEALVVGIRDPESFYCKEWE